MPRFAKHVFVHHNNSIICGRADLMPYVCTGHVDAWIIMQTSADLTKELHALLYYRVQMQVTLMLSFNHPNIVRAFRFRTFTQQPDHTDEGSFSSCTAGIAAACAATAATHASAAAAAQEAAAGANALRMSIASYSCNSSSSLTTGCAAVSTPASSLTALSGSLAADEVAALQCDLPAEDVEKSEIAPIAAAPAAATALQLGAAAEHSRDGQGYSAVQISSLGSQVSIDISLPARMVAVHDRKHKRRVSLERQQQQQQCSRDSSGQPRHDQQQQHRPPALIPLPSSHCAPGSPAADAAAAAAASVAAAAATTAAASPSANAPWSSAKGGALELTSYEHTPVYRWYPGIIDSSGARFSPPASGSMKEVARAKTMLVLVSLASAGYGSGTRDFFSFRGFAPCWLWGLTQALCLALALALASSYYDAFGSG
jgi:hypothetical protein